MAVEEGKKGHQNLETLHPRIFREFGAKSPHIGAKNP